MRVQIDLPANVLKAIGQKADLKGRSRKKQMELCLIAYSGVTKPSAAKKQKSQQSVRYGNV